MSYTTLQEQHIEQAKSNNGGWSKKQLEILGVTWPPSRGWKKSIIQKKIKEDKLKRFISLRGQHLKK